MLGSFDVFIVNFLWRKYHRKIRPKQTKVEQGGRFSFPNATNCALQVSRGMDSSVFSSCHPEDNAVLNIILKFPLTILTATSLNSAFSLDVKFDEREALL